MHLSIVQNYAKVIPRNDCRIAVISAFVLMNLLSCILFHFQFLATSTSSMNSIQTSIANLNLKFLESDDLRVILVFIREKYYLNYLILTILFTAKQYIDPLSDGKEKI